MATAPPRFVRFGVLDLGVVLAMNVLWGLNIIAVKMAVMQISPLTAAFLRQAIVLAVCATWLRIVPGRTLLLATLGVLTGGLFYIAINLSLAISDNVGALAIAGQLGVPFSLILAVLVFKERIHAPRVIGIALAFVGVALLVFDPAAAREGPGIALTAVASAIWAIASVMQRRLIGVPVLTIYAWVGCMGTLTMAPLAWAFEPDAMREIPALPLSTLGWVAFSAIGSTVMGQGAMSWLIQRHPISTVTPLTLAAPVVSVFTAAWWFATPLTWPTLAGGGVAMLGVAIVSVRTAQARDRPRDRPAVVPGVMQEDSNA